MDKKTSTESAKSPDEMGQNGIAISPDAMKKLTMLNEHEEAQFWYIVIGIASVKNWQNHVHVFTLAWEVLAYSAKRMKEQASMRQNSQ